MRVDTSLASKGENQPQNERFKCKDSKYDTIELERQTAKSTLTIEDIGSQLSKAKPTSITNKATAKQSLEVNLADLDTKNYIVDLKKGNNNILVIKFNVSKCLGCRKGKTTKQVRKGKTNGKLGSRIRREDRYFER